ncbi:MAG: L-threonylcarbamoyladenylate synthase [Woeseiaceae bacterium]
MRLFISRAADILLGGGVVTCPTDGVFGLSCMPDDADAIARLLTIKQRDPGKGLILIAASKEALRDWIAIPPESIPDPVPERPVSWIVAAAAGVSALVRGDHDGIAVRITSNPIARALCEAVDSPLISTSANTAGAPVIEKPNVLRRKFGGSVDYIVPGECGPATGPSEIRVLASGKQLR